MPRVIVDPSELRNFAAVLEHVVQDIRASKSGVTSSFKDLHDYWKDHKEDRFEPAFKLTMVRLDSFLNRSEELIRYLRKKARLGDDYLEGGY